MEPKVSLVIPCLNEERFIRGVLDDILQQDYPKSEMEVLFVDGGSTDQTRKILTEYHRQNPYIQLIENPDRYVPQAMNRGIQQASGSVIIRLDAHASYPPDYVSKLVYWLEKTGADNVGGIWITKPRSDSAKALAIASVLAHPFGVGNSMFRLGVDEPTEVDTVPFGCYPRKVFDQYGYYDERLHRNQDIELNKRIRKMGGRIILVPEVSCTYYARDTYRGLWRNNFQTGRWVLHTYRYAKQPLSLRHFIPFLFVSYFGLALLWAIKLAFIEMQSSLEYLFLLPLIAYLLLISWASLGKHIPQRFISFLTLHFGYGLGSWQGLLEVVLRIKP